ncbi:Transcriptional regulatory protein-like protein [Emericellopsis cladophorae]|uniref:Transcriptional regulatory protein-like protein n=1 Tax=Emericellopsis cladophorae TaxID=2686198 RepID=A0A9P9XWS3_9HYPO|nr:Transcriptional regulatory protein-like protein [Emericellopsis cladophorae]KAI6778784.1 Transcriptional regulatory protein-like protein [Emericellopsis cladophorae]
MKSAKPQAPEALSNRRSQPARQARTNPARNANVARSTAGRDESVGEQPIDIFPAITYFADTMTALPKELVRHFALLREVDAKISGPEEQLFGLVGDALANTAAEDRLRDGQRVFHLPLTAPTSFHKQPSNGRLLAGALQSGSSTTAGNPPTEEDLILRRRHLFGQISYKIQEMLVSLEEKNHVINTANEALQRQLARVDDVWPYLENEFSDEAKWGSTTHWAYPENRNGRTAHPERTRRDGAAAISAAAQVIAEEAAARSDARKQALQAKKTLKAQQQQQESDFDEIEGRHQKGENKKSAASKVRKTAETSNVGLGISGVTNGSAPPKKRKAENATNSLSQSNGTPNSSSGPAAPKGKVAAAAADATGPQPKKRKALPSASGQAKKYVVRHRTHQRALTEYRNGMSPSVASSPVLGSLPEPRGLNRASPAPNTNPRPATSRARGNSIASLADAAKNRPASVASARANGNGQSNSEAGQTTSVARAPSVPRSIKESSVPSSKEQKKEQERPEVETPTAPPPPPERRETKAAAAHERRKSESVPPVQTPATVTTKSGRASKPSTPALPTFQEAAQSRSRSSRTADNGGAKKSHKKGAASTTQALAPPPVEEGLSSGEGDIEDEPLYCYCNGISYGEMVGCDSDDCEREWFHLSCVGLKVAPAGKFTSRPCAVLCDANEK